MTLLSGVDVVLDTNVVLGWLLFGDSRCRTLVDSLQTGRVRWLASQPLLDELRHVLERGIAGWPFDGASLLAECERWVCCSEPVVEARTVSGMRCTDVDDQKFIDFALASGAVALLTHDCAVLKLSHRAAQLGLWIGPPERWHPPHTPT